MNKACFILIVSMIPASLFAGETMITHTSRTAAKCDFRVDKCETSVATDPNYVRFNDGTSVPGPADVGSTHRRLGFLSCFLDWFPRLSRNATATDGGRFDCACPAKTQQLSRGGIYVR